MFRFVTHINYWIMYIIHGRKMFYLGGKQHSPYAFGPASSESSAMRNSSDRQWGRVGTDLVGLGNLEFPIVLLSKLR